MLWRDPDIMASQYTTCVEHEGHLYGVEGRQDGPPADLRCFDAKARKVLWTQPSFGYATLIRAGDKLLILTTDGTLVLARPTRTSMRNSLASKSARTPCVPFRLWPTACSTCVTASCSSALTCVPPSGSLAAQTSRVGPLRLFRTDEWPERK